MDYIVSILGKASKKAIDRLYIFTPLKSKNKKYIILLLGLSKGKLEPPINSILSIGDVEHKIKGKVKVIGVTMYGKKLLDEVPMGTRCFVLFEIIDVNDNISFEKSLITLDKYDYLSKRFWIYEGDFEQMISDFS